MLPILIISILLISAVCLCFIKNVAHAKIFAMATYGAALALAVVMAATIVSDGYISLIIGSAPWNIEILAGPVDAIIVLIFTGISFFIMWASLSMLGHDLEPKRIPYYYALMSALIAALCGVVMFNSFFNIFIWIEIGSFAAAGIVIIKNKPETLKAGLKYLSLSIMGSGFMLMGIVTLFFMAGTTTFSMTDLGVYIANNFAGNESSVHIALVFLTIGLALKAALFPLHIWLPDAHGSAVSPSSAVLSALVLKAPIIFYIKILHRVIGIENMLNDPFLSTMLMVVMIAGVSAMMFGSMMALLQKDIKRMIAYSSVAQIGYIFMGIGMGTTLGLLAAIFHILAHAVAKSTLFLVAGSTIEQTGEKYISKMAGLGKKMPITMALFTLGALSMIGIPLFIGFNSKWFFGMAIVDSQHIWLMIVLALSAMLNGLYYLPIVVRAYLGKEAKEAAAAKINIERPVKNLMPIMILAGLIIIIALASSPIYNYIDYAIGRI
ncbi:MAG: hypothetical protein LBE35_06690 [Clostridiales bacterium]|jgi:multicomponent Na+:H+ antiporter subunit D|nr:hypothetical protein [Clostridiales bacterium]